MPPVRLKLVSDALVAIKRGKPCKQSGDTLRRSSRQ
jgi:hypothetical protein